MLLNSFLVPVARVMCFVILLLFFLLGGERCDYFSPDCSALHSWGHVLGSGHVSVAGVPEQEVQPELLENPQVSRQRSARCL